MENEFKNAMSKRTDEELVKIVTVKRSGYNPVAIEAAATRCAQTPLADLSKSFS